MNQPKKQHPAFNYSYEDLLKMTPLDRLTKALLLLLTAPANREKDAMSLVHKFIVGMTQADIEIAKAKASAIYQAV